MIDPLDEMPAESRAPLVVAIREVLGVDVETAERVIRSSEPLWSALEQGTGLVDAWGGLEFCQLLPHLLEVVLEMAHGPG